MPPHQSAWDAWSAARPAATVNHLDSGAAGRSSQRTLDATSAHARREATEGAYVAAAAMAPTLATLRANVAGLLGVDPEGVAFTESAESALDIALRVWPFDGTATVAVAPSEWGPNLHAFATAGHEVVTIVVDGLGVIDVDALARRIRTDPPTIVHVTQQASHRAVRQPVPEIAAVCREADVALWVDAAQAIGHCPTDGGADLVYATSRKWLTGPRGIGMLAVADRRRPSLRIARKPMLNDAPALANLESHEAHVVGRIGLANAIEEYLTTGPPAVWAQLDAIGRMTRECLADVSGWDVVDPVDAPGAISAIRPTAGQEVFAERERLLREHAIVTTPCSPARAPLDMTEPWLRISPHVDGTTDQIESLGRALASYH